MFVPGKAIGMTPGPKFDYCYETPLHALADGWELLAPPLKEDDGTYEWWLTKD